MVAEKQRTRPLTWPWTRREPWALSEHASSGETPAFVQRGETVHHNQAAPNRCLWTRDLMIVGLILGWGASFATMSTGIYIIASGWVPIPYFLFARVARVGATMGYTWMRPTSPYLIDHRVYGVSEATMIIIPLLLQIAITCVCDCLNSIHATTLRWALWREGRLRYNTNMRLFTSSRQICSPNGWPANMAWATGLVLVYGGATIMTFPVTVIGTLDLTNFSLHYDGDIGPDCFGIDFNGWGLVGLGVGLLLQVIICTWCLLHESARYVETWNANPLATARACRDRLLGGVPDSDSNPSREATLTAPASKQPSMGQLIPASRIIANWIWAIFALYAILTLAVILVAACIQRSASIDFVRKYPAPINIAGVWQFFGQVTIQYSDSSFLKRREWAGLLIQCAGLSILLFGLHLADVLGGLARDEAIWRRAATGPRGASPDSNILLESVRSWPVCVIFVYKSLIPWVFSYGYAPLTRLFMAILPLLTVALLLLTLALLAEYLIRLKPKGSQPSAYGNMQALAAFVDEWDHDRLFWGHKGVLDRNSRSGVYLAGTAGHRLADLHPGVLYQGLDREPSSEQKVRGGGFYHCY